MEPIRFLPGFQQFMAELLAEALEITHRIRIGGDHPQHLAALQTGQRLAGLENGQWTAQPGGVKFGINGNGAHGWIPLWQPIQGRFKCCIPACGGGWRKPANPGTAPTAIESQGQSPFAHGTAMSHRSLVTVLSLSVLLSLTPAAPARAQTPLLLPDIGDPSQVYFSPDEEQQLGLEIMRHLRDRDRVLDDVQLTQYINSVGQSLANYADQNGVPFTFFMVRDPSINAFALPYNFIGINTGLLLATEREDELAGVVAHEIAHVAQHHIVRAIADNRRMTLPMAAAMLASAALAASAGGQAGRAAMVGSMAANAQRQISFTRANEQEADRIGTQVLVQAGFDPRGMSDFFTKLERMSGGEDRTQIPEMLLTHPRPENRVADTQDRLPSVPARRTVPRDRQAYLLAKARALVLSTSDTRSLIRELEIRLAKATPAEEAATRYAYALALKQAGRYDESYQQVERLLREQPDRLAFRLEAAEIALARGDRAEAWRLFEDTRRLYPDDFVLAMYYGRALASQGDGRQAMRLLQPHLRRYPNDPTLYATYAQAAQRAGDQAATRTTLAEYHYLNGDLRAAIEQLEIGLRQSDLSPNQEAQLRARLKQFKAEAIARKLPGIDRNTP